LEEVSLKASICRCANLSTYFFSLSSNVVCASHLKERLVGVRNIPSVTLRVKLKLVGSVELAFENLLSLMMTTEMLGTE